MRVKYQVKYASATPPKRKHVRFVPHIFRIWYCNCLPFQQACFSSAAGAIRLSKDFLGDDKALFTHEKCYSCTDLCPKCLEYVPNLQMCENMCEQKRRISCAPQIKLIRYMRRAQKACWAEAQQQRQTSE